MPTPLKGWCPQCRAPLEFPANDPDAVIDCPNCGRRVASRAALTDNAQSTRNRRVAWLVGSAVVLLALLVAGYIYRGHVLSALDFIAEATGSRTTAALSVAGGLLVLLWLLLWMLFPIVVYFGLRDLRRRTAELDETTRLCVRHLAQLNAERDLARAQRTESGKAPGVEST